MSLEETFLRTQYTLAERIGGLHPESMHVYATRGITQAALHEVLQRGITAVSSARNRIVKNYSEVSKRY